MSRSKHSPLSALGIDAAIARRLLELSLERGGDYADVYFEHRISADHHFRDRRLAMMDHSATVGVGVRVIDGDAVGYAFSEEPSFARMAEAAKKASAIASSGKTVAPVEIVPSPVADYYPVQAPSALAALGDKVALLAAADAAAHAHDPRIVSVEASLHEQLREIAVATSTGTFARDVQPLLRFTVRAIAEEKNKRHAGSSGGGGRYGLEYFLEPGRSPAAQGRRAAETAIAMLDARDTPAGEMTVVVAPGAAGIMLHEAVGHGLEADFNQKKSSRFTDRIGERVASEQCTIIDDGTFRFARGSIDIDDEGTPGAKNVLIERGVLQRYLHDRRTAWHFAAAPSGNGRRASFRTPPMPRMTNTYLAPGPYAPEEILASVGRGVYARRFSSGNVDIASGDFTFDVVEGFLIENGRITAPLKYASIIGNGPEVLSRVSMVGRDFELSDGVWTCMKNADAVPIGVGLPTLKIDRVTVGGTAGGR